MRGNLFKRLAGAAELAYRSAEDRMRDSIARLMELEFGEWEDNPARLRAEVTFAFRNPGFVTTVGKAAGTRENEMVFWNYLVGSSKTRAEHNAALARAAPGWKRELRKNPLLKIRIMGSASSASGDAAANQRIALARAERIRSILVRGFGLPDERILTESRGDTLPLADEMAPDDPRNMARDRRVEIFLFTPTRLVEKIDRVSVAFSGIASNLDTNPETRMGLAKVIGGDWVERHFGVGVDGRATWAGPPDSSIGFLQVMTNHTRRGFYRAQSGKQLILDLARCTAPFLPCRDMTDAADGLSQDGKSGTGRFTRVVVKFTDHPGHALPLRVNDPVIGTASLQRSHWLATFVLLFGVRRGESFLPLNFLTWEIMSVRTFPGGRPVVGPIARRINSGDGAPLGILGLSKSAFEQAMSGATCRLRTRSIDTVRVRTPADECPEIPRGRACPPLVCAGRVDRF